MGDVRAPSSIGSRGCLSGEMIEVGEEVEAELHMLAVVSPDHPCR